MALKSSVMTHAGAIIQVDVSATEKKNDPEIKHLVAN